MKLLPEGWQRRSLADCAMVQRGKFGHRPRNDPAFYGGATPFVQTGEVSNAVGPICEFSQTLNERGLAVSKVFPKGTLLITIVGANIGSVAELGINAACPDSLIAITPRSGVHREYLRQFLQTQKTRINYLAPANARQNISLEFLGPLPVPLPPFAEQERLAGLFFAWDTATNRLAGLIGVKETLKLGLMQQLLTGRRRFKWFKDGWLHCHLGDVVQSVWRPVAWEEAATLPSGKCAPVVWGLVLARGTLRASDQGEEAPDDSRGGLPAFAHSGSLRGDGIGECRV